MGVAAIAFGTLTGLFGGVIASLLFSFGFWDMLAAVGLVQLALAGLLLAGAVFGMQRPSARRRSKTAQHTGATVARLFGADKALPRNPNCRMGDMPCEICPYRGARGG